MKKFDDFGEQVYVNYKGEYKYQTLIGALCSLALKTFILVYAANSTIALFQYDDPKITQVSHLVNRSI